MGRIYNSDCVFDREAFLEMLGGDEEMMEEILADYLTDAREIIATLASTGAQGEDMPRVVHSLKGSSANVRAMRVRGAAARLESAMKTDEAAADRVALIGEIRTAYEEFAAHVRTLYPHLA